MKAQYLLIEPLAEKDLEKALSTCRPVAFKGIRMTQVGRNKWRCNREKDPVVSIYTVVTRLGPPKTRRRVYFKGFTKIHGPTEEVDGIVTFDRTSGTMIFSD